MLVIAVAQLAFAKNKAPNRNAQYDVGAASLQLSLEATARGLVVHQMAGFDPEMASAEFSIPELFEPVVIIAVGYLGDPHVLHAELQAKELGPRTRRPLQEVVFEEAWGEASPLFIPDEGSAHGRAE